MSKLVLFFSLLGVATLLVVGLLEPRSFVFWMASTEPAFMYARAAMIAVLLGLLLTHPPRNLLFRLIVGTFSVGLVGWALQATYTNQMDLLDTMAFLATGVSAGLEVMEGSYEAFLLRAKRIPVRFES